MFTTTFTQIGIVIVFYTDQFLDSKYRNNLKTLWERDNVVEFEFAICLGFGFPLLIV